MCCTDYICIRHGIVLRRRRNGSGSNVNDQDSLKIPSPKHNVEHPLIQESDNEEDSRSPSSNYNMFAFENKSLAAAPVACMGFGSTSSIPDVDQGTLLESLPPYDLNHQQQRVPYTDIPMTGNYTPSIRDRFLDQTPVGVSDVFAFDRPWNEDAVALRSMNVAPGSIDTPSTPWTASEDSDSRTVLTLYNVDSETLNSILETVFRSKTEIKMETYH